MRPSPAPLMWSHQGKRAANGLLIGFDQLGLGMPSTFWLAADQAVGLTPFVTRYGFPWTKVQNDGGSLVKDAAGWSIGARPTVRQVASGIAVEVGLQCNSMAPGLDSLNYDFTYSCPVVWPAAFLFGSDQVYFAASDNALTNLAIPVRHVASNTRSTLANLGGVAAIPPTSGPTALGFSTTTMRRGLMATTGQVRGGNRVWQTKLRYSGGTISWTSGTVVGTSGTDDLLQFGMGFIPDAATGLPSSANLSFGGACCWKGIGASDSQLTAILDKWATLYPLS